MIIRVELSARVLRYADSCLFSDLKPDGHVLSIFFTQWWPHQSSYFSGCVSEWTHRSCQNANLLDGSTVWRSNRSSPCTGQCDILFQ